MKHRYTRSMVAALGAALLPGLAAAQDPPPASAEVPAIETPAAMPATVVDPAGAATSLPPIAATSQVQPAAGPMELPPGAVAVDAYGNPVAYGGPDGYAPGAYGPPAAPPPRAPRTITPMRGTLGLTVGYLGLMDNRGYANTTRLWGFGEFRDAMVVGLDGGAHVSPNFLVGARVGYLTAGGGRARADGAELALDSVDVGAILRAGAPVALGRDWVFFPGVQLDVGAAMPRVRLRGETQGAVLPRVAGELIALFSSRYVGLSTRVAYQYANWGGAGGPGVDISLGGFSLSLGLEVRL